MNPKEMFLSVVDLFEGIGAEVMTFMTLVSGIVLLARGDVTGGQYVDLAKVCIGAYVGHCALGGTASSIMGIWKGKKEDSQ